jgi:hypothetical protein
MSSSSRQHGFLVALLESIALLCVACLAFWACAPAATFRPLTPMAVGQSNEFGVGGVATYASEDLSNLGYWDLAEGPLTGSAQIWYSHRFNDQVDLGTTLFGGYTSLVGAGIQSRYAFLRRDHFRLGIDAEIGWFWAEIGLPFACRLSDDLWLYSGPSAGFRVPEYFRLPVGFAFQLSDQTALDVEMGVGMARSIQQDGRSYQVGAASCHIGVAMAWRY